MAKTVHYGIDFSNDLGHHFLMYACNINECEPAGLYLKITTDKPHVTCGNCKRTKVFKK